MSLIGKSIGFRNSIGNWIEGIVLEVVEEGKRIVVLDKNINSAVFLDNHHLVGVGE